MNANKLRTMRHGPEQGNIPHRTGNPMGGYCELQRCCAESKQFDCFQAEVLEEWDLSDPDGEKVSVKHPHKGLNAY